MALDQKLWNLLFSWITGRKCFLPEGCSPPVAGILIYILITVAVSAAYNRKEVSEAWKILRK
ncbi:MAG: hypothetical protein ABEJ03_05805 [Candidatus Nanohaloarchaea archaeon]